MISIPPRKGQEERNNREKERAISISATKKLTIIKKHRYPFFFKCLSNERVRSSKVHKREREKQRGNQ
jgi:hypothetical protein